MRESIPPRTATLENLKGTCLYARCFRDSLASHWDESPRPYTRYCHMHAWRSLGIRVELDPLMDAINAETGARERRRKGWRKGVDQQDLTVNISTDITNRIGVIGEFAAMHALGGELMGKGKAGDLRNDSGLFEVKTGYRSWPYDRWWPSVSIKSKFPPEADTILCVTDGHDVAYVVAWIPLDRMRRHMRGQSWGWWLELDPTRDWRSVREIQEWRP